MKAELLEAARAAEAKQDWLTAVALYTKAEALDSSDHRLPANRGNALWLADAPFEALRALQKAVTLAPCEPLPLRGLGNVLRDLNRFEAADAAYSRAVQLDHNPYTQWNRSQTLMGLEQYDKAYHLAEARFQLPQFPLYRRGPCWQGWPLCERLNIWTEQGYGDTFQYLRWIVPLSRWGVPLTLEVEPSLLTLLREGLAWLPHPPRVVAKLEQAHQLDEPHGSLLSLPYLLGGAPLSATFSSGLGYLRSPSWPLAERRGPRPRVGLVWAAGRKLDQPFTTREYQRRSLPTPALEALIEGLQRQGAALTNLQFGPDRHQAQHLSNAFSATLPPTADFAEAAAAICDLDLVISVDTASAHLVGALGRPGWILLPWSADPRWLRNRSTSPWYPSLTLLRQPSHGNWEGLVSKVLGRFSRWLK